jgi:hypothetical protein
MHLDQVLMTIKTLAEMDEGEVDKKKNSAK